MLHSLPPQLQDYLFALLRLCLWLTLLVMIFVPLERLFAAHPQRIFRKGLAADLAYYFLSSLLPALILSSPVALLAWGVHLAVPSSFLAFTASLPNWAKIVAALIAGEIGYYWGHRLSHEIPFLWSFHSIHHSAQHVDFLVNTRAHPVDLVFGRFCAYVPMYVLGLAAPTSASASLVPVIVTLITTFWGYFIHANLRWRFGFLEGLITTPAFHHWHHTLSGPINRNYSSTLPWIDRIFRTHYLPKEYPTAYGIDAPMPDSLAGQLAYPLRAPAPNAGSAPRSTPADNTNP